MTTMPAKPSDYGVLNASHSLRMATGCALKAGHAHVPALPWAAVGLLCRGTPPPLPWLVNALNGDEALASAVLRIANSPSYQPRRPLLTVAHVASRLGAHALGEIALAAALQAQLNIAGFENELRAFWRQALAAAVFAKDLGDSCGVQAEEAFACALLHEIGHPFALSEAVRRCTDFGWTPTAPGMHQAVLHTARSLAPLAANYVIDAWGLPAAIAGAIVQQGPAFRVTDSPQAAVAHMATQMAASLYRRESPWEPDSARLAVNDATAAALPQRGHSVRTVVESLTI